MKIKNTNKGFTIVELALVMTVIALVITFGMPALFEQIRREQAKSQAYDLFTYMLSAQELSVSTGRVIAIVPADVTKNDPTDSNYWLGELLMTYVSENNLNTGTLSLANVRPTTPDETLHIANSNILDNTNHNITVHVPATEQNAWPNQFMLFHPDGIFFVPAIELKSKTSGKAVTAVGGCTDSSVTTEATLSYLGKLTITELTTKKLNEIGTDDYIIEVNAGTESQGMAIDNATVTGGLCKWTL